LIARIEKECTHCDLPPIIAVADIGYLDYARLKQTADVLLTRPLTSASLFNAVNTTVSRLPHHLERVLQSTNFNELRALWLSGVRILVVDDSEINLEVAQRILEKQGAAVTTCADGYAALEHLRARAQLPDIVLMDVQMPALDGNETTRRIRTELRLTRLPIVALTAGALVVERQRALEAGMNDFISKPFDPQTLIRKVRLLVEESRGEPIPMAICDPQPAASTSGTWLPPSIDAGVVTQMFGEDLTLFKSVLGRMLREYADLTLPVHARIDDEASRTRLKARTHKLKGSAGMVGATRIMRLAGAVESALLQDRPGKAIDRILQQLASALNTLDQEADPYLRNQQAAVAATAGDERPPANIGLAELDALCALLDSQNLEALDKFSHLSPALSAILSAERFERLREAIEVLDFPGGAKLLRESRGLLNAVLRSEQAGHA
jgi:CheY-like chemotaxis protein